MMDATVDLLRSLEWPDYLLFVLLAFFAVGLVDTARGYVMAYLEGRREKKAEFERLYERTKRGL